MARQPSEHLLVSFLVVLVLCAEPGLGTSMGKGIRCIERERQALLHFKHRLVDDHGLLSSWGDEQHKRECCQWRGVHCSKRSGHIVKLHLPAPPTENFDLYQSLRGEISPSLIELEHLNHLDLSCNDFQGNHVPPFLASLTKMQYLNLSHAHFTGPLPNQLGNLSNLRSLDLGLNDDLNSGNLEWLSHLSSLRHLDLDSVNLGKAIHWSQVINKLPSLIHLNLEGCSLPPLTTPSLFHVNSSAPLAFLDLSDNYGISSSIYPWLFKFTTLVHLDLSWNPDLNASIVDAFGNMISLAYLDLNSCALEGEIPDALGNTSSLTYLDLSSNQLQGSIPNTVGKMSSLTYLDLSRNHLKGSIPNTVGNLASLQWLFLNDNQLQGSIPDTLGNLASLERLYLYDNRLQGSIPDAFGNMSSLEYLVISSNQLQGSIPGAIGNMSSLTHLYLSSNQLQGSIPSAVGNLASLERLNLDENQLQGPLPDTLGNMSSLTHLHLSLNQLQGPIPDTIGNLSSLEGLYLNKNKLEGEIPKSLRNLCSLYVFDLHSNNLSGQLPQDLLACASDILGTLSLYDNQLRGSIPHLIGFSSLRFLDLGFNQLNGTLPKSVGQLTQLQNLGIGSNSLQGAISEAHFFRLSHLDHLDLSSNFLTFNMSLEWVPPFQLSSLVLTSCKLGPRFPSWLRTQKYLREIDISNSEILDVIPDWFWNLASGILMFNLSNNHITGTLPNFASTFRTPLYIDMSSNYLESSIPQIPADLTWLDLSNNSFSGSISLFCTVNNSYLVYLNLGSNFLTGGLRNCGLQWKKLRVLNLENNQFSEKIPKSFGSLHVIQTMHLRNNNLIGELPLSLKNCKTLKLIDLGKNRLSGKIPLWIGGSFPNLTVLNLRSNKFSGSISLELCQLKKIQILDLSGNNMSGNIPRCLNNFTAMTEKGSLTIAYNYRLEIPHYFSINSSFVDRELIKWKGRDFEYKNTLGLVKSIDLSSNNLTGEIPKEVGDLLELVSLNLSRNNLTGSIPATIGQLKSLDVLDLSRNQLLGAIPTSLSKIDRLSVLDLSNNNLSGKIPQGTQLQSFYASTYEGNPTLCGPPLLKKCRQDSVEEAPNTYDNEDNIQQDENDMWFYVSIAFGFIFGFWGMCGTLLLNNSWRYSYFLFLNKIKDWLYVTTTINMARIRRSLRS